MKTILIGALAVLPLALVACKSGDVAHTDSSAHTAGIPATGHIVLAVTGMT